MSTPALRADCANCFALCCVATAFHASANFAIDKPAGTPCPNLLADFRCGIHDRLRPQGFSGCVTFDCLGAGQQVAQVTYGGRDWRAAPETAREMFGVFTVMRQLHELLWYLTEAVTRAGDRADLVAALAEVTAHTGGDPESLLALDVAALRERIRPLLARTSELVRAEVPDRKDWRGVDRIGADLRRADLRGASLRGAVLIAADLRRADLRLADLIGADLRDANVAGADLTGSIFVTQPQLNAANGDRDTRIPPNLDRPAHW